MAKKKTYLTKDGRVISAFHKDIGASWREMHEARVDGQMTRAEHMFLEKYGLTPTIFNVSNLREFGLIHLTPYWARVVLDHGARDMRDEEYRQANVTARRNPGIHRAYERVKNNELSIMDLREYDMAHLLALVTYSNRMEFGDDSVPVRVFDNGGVSADRYAVILDDRYLFGMSDRPFHPQGVNMFGFDARYQGEINYSGLGEQVSLDELPKDVVIAIIDRIVAE